MENNDIIYERVGEPALLEQMAEECIELAHACLKFARLQRGENPTPLTNVELGERIREEWTDVRYIADILELRPDEGLRQEKERRFLDRLS